MGEIRKKILVHICCAACFSYVNKVLNGEGYKVIGFFYNPQIHGKSEYEKRLRDVKDYCESNKIRLIIPEYDIQEFFKPIMPFQDKNSIKYINNKKRWRNKRCQICFSIVLLNTYKTAKEKRIKNFTTTFLTTPYKDHDEIWNIGLELEREGKIAFYYKDFRKGYWFGRNYARNHKMIMPSYCGCVYSSEEGILE